MNEKLTFIVGTGFIILLSLGLYFLGAFGSPKGSFKRLAKTSKEEGQLLKEKAAERIRGLGIVQNYYAAKVSEEIGEGLAIMRNLILSDEAASAGSDEVLMKLSQNGGLLEETYRSMLSYLRTGKTEDARAAMTSWGGQISEEYANLILAWDELQAKMLLEIVLSFQKSLREAKATASRKKDEMISDLIYIPAVFNVMLVFINFIYVGYFLEQKEMLQSVFR